jgi:hypothetical protein
MERLGARPELLSIIGSWCDPSPDEEILAAHSAGGLVARSRLQPGASRQQTATSLPTALKRPAIAAGPVVCIAM